MIYNKADFKPEWVAGVEKIAGVCTVIEILNTTVSANGVVLGHVNAREVLNDKSNAYFADTDSAVNLHPKTRHRKTTR